MVIVFADWFDEVKANARFPISGTMERLALAAWNTGCLSGGLESEESQEGQERPEGLENQESFQVEIRDYKAAVKYMYVLCKQQMEDYHKHLWRVHKDSHHRMNWERCLGQPCARERLELAKVEAVMVMYKRPGDPRGAPDGAL